MSEADEYRTHIRQEIYDLQNQIDWLKDYVKHITYFCSFIGVLIIVIFYQLHSKGIYSIPLI